MKSLHNPARFAALCLTAITLFCVSAAPPPPYGLLSLDLRDLRRMDVGVDQWQQVDTQVKWAPGHTAVVVCDMWDQHWSPNASARISEMAPRVNQVITELRQRGVLIIHCPADTMSYYEGTPGRQLAQAAPAVDMTVPADASSTEATNGWCNLNTNREARLPIDDSDLGDDDTPPVTPPTPSPDIWQHDISAVHIEPGDAITDSKEAFYLMRERGITNVIIMGLSARPRASSAHRSASGKWSIRARTSCWFGTSPTACITRSGCPMWTTIAADLMAWHIEKYWCPTITSDQIVGGKPFRFVADATRVQPSFHNFVKLPSTDVHYKGVKSYIEDTPNPDYYQAPESSRAALREIKFGVRIHWGVYCKLGYGEDASWPFVRADSGHPGLNNEQRQEYQQFYQTFNPTNFNADAWMELFTNSGMRVVAFTTKHHDGFSMFDTHTRVLRRVNWTNSPPKIEDCDFAYSIMDSPYHRDIVKQVTDAARRHGVKIDLYFSWPDWYDADFRPFADHPLHDRVDRAAHPDQWNHFVMRARQQLTELLTQYGKIDIIDLDQYYDQTAWLDTRETIKIARQLQPQVIFRGPWHWQLRRLLYARRFRAWRQGEHRHALDGHLSAGRGEIWAYEPDGTKYKNGDWIVKNLVDIVAKGGNFMVGVGPDPTGLFHPKAVAAFQYAGLWLRTNGEAIYHTHPMPGDSWKDGDNLRFTQSDLGPITYAVSADWPGPELTLHNTKLTPACHRDDAGHHRIIAVAPGRRFPGHHPARPLAVARRPALRVAGRLQARLRLSAKD